MFLEGKIAIVTAGGGPGIGRAVSRALANEGAAVVIAELDRARAEEAAAEIRDAGGTVLAVPTDVTLKSDVVDMVQRTVDEFGRVDILCNHAGAATGGPIEDMPEEVWDAHLGVALKGTFLCTQAVVSHMRRHRWGRIVRPEVRRVDQLGARRRLAEPPTQTSPPTPSRWTATSPTPRATSRHAPQPRRRDCPPH